MLSAISAGNFESVMISSTASTVQISENDGS
jgi:hypothetical protein